MRAPDQCVILMRPYSASAPATWVAIDARPFPDYLLLEAWRFGFRKVLMIAEDGTSRARACLDASRIGEETRLAITVVESRATGSGGALHAARGRLDDHFLLLDGSSWFDFNWLSLVTTEGAADAVATLALRQPAGASPRKSAQIDGTTVRGFGSGPGPVTGGVYLMSSRILEHISPTCSLDTEVFPRLAEAGALRGLVASGRFIDIADPADRATAGRCVPKWRQRPAVFLDRDGTLNLDTGYVHRAADVQWLPGAIHAVRRLNDNGVYVFVVTNQSGVARGMFEETAVHDLHRWMNDELRAAGAHVDDMRYCPHHPDGTVGTYRAACACRKPAGGMILDLMEHWPVVASSSVMVGDKEIDAAAGRAAGIASEIVPPGGLEAFVDRFLLRQSATADQK